MKSDARNQWTEPMWPEAEEGVPGIVRRLLQLEARTIGFIALHGVADSLRVIERLAECVANEAPIIVIDASGKCLSGADLVAESDSALVFRQPRAGLVLVAPSPAPGDGAYARRLEQTLSAVRSRCEYVFVDLSAIESLGDRLSSARCVDTVCLLGAAGASDESELIRTARELGSGRVGGVLLLSG